MLEIYSILTKHFLGESSPEEEERIQVYKLENRTEYELLSLLWREEMVSIKEFDSTRALEKVKAQQQERTPIKKLSSRNKRKQIISVAAVFVLGIVSAYYMLLYNPLIIETNSLLKEKEIVLSDGSKVWLNTNSTIRFPRKFKELERKIELEGEAFFEVVKNSEKPFVVKTHNSTTRVLGTSFNVNSSEELTTVSVQTGKVEVSDKSQTKKVVILPEFSSDVEGKQVTKYKTENDNLFSWKTKVLVFKESTLDEVEKALEHHFKVEINFLNQSENCRFTGSFNDPDLKDVLTEVSMAFNIHYYYEKDTYYLTIDNCD